MLIDYCEAARLHEQETGELKKELLRGLQQELLTEIYGKEE